MTTHQGRPPQQSPNLAVRTCVGVWHSLCGCSSGVLLPGSDSAGSNIKANQNRTATSKQSEQKQTRECTSTSLFQLQALSLRLRHTGKHVQPEQKGAGSTWRQRNRKEAEASCITRLFACFFLPSGTVLCRFLFTKRQRRRGRTGGSLQETQSECSQATT